MFSSKKLFVVLLYEENHQPKYAERYHIEMEKCQVFLEYSNQQKILNTILQNLIFMNPILYLMRLLNKP